MKNISDEFRKHLKGDVTSLSTFWIIRKKDGEVLRFTDSDEDTVVQGNTYRSTGSYSRSAIESTATLSVDNLEIEGISGGLSLPKKELNAGAFNNADVEIFMASWIPSVEGILKLRKGVFGEARVMQNGTFTVEIRGLMQKLAHTYTDVYSATCRHDLGDSGCKIDISHPFGTEGVHIPIPFLDANFEELGVSGISRSIAWSNPITEESLVDNEDSYAGEFSAHATSSGGFLTQYVDLGRMDETFLHNIDRQKVTFTGHAWRKDVGGSGRIQYEFFGSDMQPVRKHSGSYRFNNGGTLTDVPTTTLYGDFTVEVWLKPDYDATTGNYAGKILQGNKPEQETDASVFNCFQSLEVDEQGNIVYNSEELDAGQSRPEGLSHPLNAKAGTWFHVAVTRAGDTFSLYLDGELVDSIDDPDHPDFFEFDRVAEYSSSWDELRVWEVARTQIEISYNRFTDMPTGTLNLIEYYPLDGDTLNYGSSPTASQFTNPDGMFVDEYTPVAMKTRGDDLSLNTGFQDVGGAWTLVSEEDKLVPAHTRYIKVTFDHDPQTANPGGTRLDSLFGWFEDSANSRDMPNFGVGENDAVWKRAGMVTFGEGGRVFQASIDEPRQSTPGWFQGGLVTFYSGENAGGSMEVKTWNNLTSEIELFLSMPYPVKQGDLFTIYPGCDKSRIGCVALFNNIQNFFGTPDVPGEDELVRYPDSKQ